MTCFLYNGKTARKYCSENGLRYDRFFYWMEKGLSVEESIEKIRNNNHHNLKWEYNGKSIYVYCKENNLLYNSVIRAIKKGKSVEEAIKKSQELRYNKGRPAKYKYDGKSLKKYCKLKNLFYQTIYHRIRKGFDIEKSVKGNKNV